MTDLAQKKPLNEMLNEWWNLKGDSYDQLQGRAIPAEIVGVDPTNTIATVKFNIVDDVATFPQVTCAIATSEWLVAPLLAGTKGFVVSAQLYLGGVTGLGDGQATLDQLPNMSTMVFIPLGNVDFNEVPDPEMTWIRGPKGIILQDKDGTAILEIEKDKGITINAALGGNTIKANLVEAADDAEAKSKGIPFSGFYYDPDGYVRFQRIPD